SAVTIQANSTPRRSLEAAKRSSSQLVITARLKRVLSRASASALSAHAGQSRTDCPNAACCPSLAAKPSSSPSARRQPARTSLYGRYGPASNRASWRGETPGEDATPRAAREG